MADNAPLTVTLTGAAAGFVRRQVEAGRYESADAVAEDGVLWLSETDAEVLKREVGPALDAYLALPNRVVALDDAIAGARARYQARRGA